MERLLIAVLRRLADLVGFLCGRVMEFHALPVRERIHAELLRLAQAQPISNGRAVLSPAPTHADIASRAGTHREAVTRELKKLRDAGHIEKRGRTLIIPDIERLAKLVDSEWNGC